MSKTRKPRKSKRRKPVPDGIATMTTAEAVRFLNVSDTTVCRQGRLGRLVRVAHGRYAADSVRAFAANRPGPGRPPEKPRRGASE